MTRTRAELEAEIARLNRRCARQLATIKSLRNVDAGLRQVIKQQAAQPSAVRLMTIEQMRAEFPEAYPRRWWSRFFDWV